MLVVMLCLLVVSASALPAWAGYWTMWTRSRMTVSWPDGTPRFLSSWARKKSYVSEQVCRGSIELTTRYFKDGKSGVAVVVDGDTVTFAPTRTEPANEVTGFCFPSEVADPSQSEKPWVIWSHGRLTTADRFTRLSVDSFADYPTCMIRAAETMRDMGSEDPATKEHIEIGRYRLICLPDTIDPRGPKGK